ncbi:MAG: hypothetical protein QGF92_08555, partial [Gammaproteobacteria bacterium]|nr:hypothetical protein [Gammaproteobacteria bacterium]
MASPEEILQFWFEDSCDSPDLAEKRNSFWFSVDTAVDEKIWTDYAVLVVDAGASMNCAMLGDQLASMAISNKWEGILINGLIRDSEQINQMDI